MCYCIFNFINLTCYFPLRQITKELLDVLNKDASPVGNSRVQPILDPNIQHHLTNFSLITHSFGTPAIIAVLTAFQSYLNEMVKCVDKLQAHGGQAPLTGTLPGSHDNKPKVDIDDVMSRE